MKEIIIGTQNSAKIKQISGALSGLNIEVKGLPYKMDDIEENGSTAQENARLKAKEYSQKLEEIVLSMDNALYLEGLSDNEQPGINVRRIPGTTNRPSDIEALNYYVNIIEKMGGEVNGKWEFAICLAKDGEIIDEITIISPRLFVSKPSPKIVEGYPLESIQVDMESKIYISDMTQKEQNEFWQRTIGEEICKFIERNEIL